MNYMRRTLKYQEDESVLSYVSLLAEDAGTPE